MPPNLRSVATSAYDAHWILRNTFTNFLWRARLAALGHGSRISSTARIYRASKVRIGSNSTLNDYVHLWGGGSITIGDDCLVAAHTVITSQTHDVEAIAKGLLYRETNFAHPVTIANNVWVGSHATILPGVSIGDGAIIGAGAVVTRDVPSHSVAAGVPARVIRKLR
jgi:maltose O-acetyltransferase